MRNSRLLFLVRLSFTITSWRLEGVATCPCRLPIARAAPSFLGLENKFEAMQKGPPMIQIFKVWHTVTGGEYEHTLSGKVACLCECEDRGASPTLTTFANFQILSTIVHRLSTINSWLIRRLFYQQLVDWSRSVSTVHSEHIVDNELIVDKVVLSSKHP